MPLAAGKPGTAPPAPPGHPTGAAEPGRVGRGWAALRLDRFERGVLGALAALSLWVLAVEVWQVVAHGRVWTGSDGVYLADQLQYVAWVRSAAHHGLVSNLFVLRPTPADYLQPAIAVSGALTALGVAPWLALLVWKPVAVIGCFYAVRSFGRALLPDPGPRRAALVLGLFFGSFTVVYGSFGAIGDLLPGFLSWGYVFGLIGMAAVAGALVLYARAEGQGGRVRLGPGLLGALAGLVHPWHAELLIAIVLGSELVLAGRRSWSLGRLRLPALTVVIAGLPLLYYAVLGRVDESWRLARVASKHSFPLWWVALALAPLLLAALPAYRQRPRRFLAAAARVWPPAALVVYVVSATALGATPLHAFQGVTIPLAVLAAEALPKMRPGWRRRRRLVMAAAIAAFTIPVTLYEMASARTLVAPRAGTARFIAPDEQRALSYLAQDPQTGGVITRSYLGLLVPAATGRRTFVGNCLWSEPGCDWRLAQVKALFTGGMSAPAARAFLTGEPARFLLADCRPSADLVRLLEGLIASVHRFGCATVYVLRVDFRRIAHRV